VARQPAGPDLTGTPLAGVDSDQGSIAVKLTKDQIEHSPSLNRDKPVSRQFERAYFGFYGLPV